MKPYIFITTEGLTFQPNSESPEPDIENCQVIAFSYGNDVRDAFENMLKDNRYLLETNFDEVIGMELKNEEKTYFYINDYRQLEKSQTVEDND